MKMKLLDRLILRFGALLTVLTGGISIAAGILLYGHDLGEGVVMGLLPLILIISGRITGAVAVSNQPKRKASSTTAATSSTAARITDFH